MIRRGVAALLEGPWFRSWKVLLVSTAVYTGGAIVFAVIALASIDLDQGHAAGFAALAIVFLVGVAVVSLFIAIVLAYALYRSVAKTAISIGIVVAGFTVFWTSGWFFGFLPLFVIACVSGILGLYESVSDAEAGWVPSG